MMRDGTGFLEWKPLENGVFTEGAKIKIGVVGISVGAGATFVSSRIAYELGRQCDGVCYVEAGKGERLAVHSLSMASVYRREKFTDYFAAWDEGLAAGCKVNLFENVNWVLRASQQAPELRGRAGEMDSWAKGGGWRAAAGRGAGPEDFAASPAAVSAPLSGCGSTHAAAGFWDLGPAAGRRSGPTGAEVGPSARGSVHTGCSEEPTRGTAARSPSEPSTASAPGWANAIDRELRPASGHAQANSTSSEVRPSMAARRPRSLREELAAPRPALGRIPFERIPGHYMVVDSPAPSTMREMDLMVCIVDPLPSAVIAGSGLAAALRDNRIRTASGYGPALNDPTPCLWVLNKDNSRVAHRELERYLKVKFDFVIPMIDPSEFYRAEYSAMPIFKAIARPGGDETNGRTKAVSETAALAARIRTLLPIF